MARRRSFRSARRLTPEQRRLRLLAALGGLVIALVAMQLFAGRIADGAAPPAQDIEIELPDAFKS